jgi:hypothetical protein
MALIWTVKIVKNRNTSKIEICQKVILAGGYMKNRVQEWIQRKTWS